MDLWLITCIKWPYTVMLYDTSLHVHIVPDILQRLRNLGVVAALLGLALAMAMAWLLQFPPKIKRAPFWGLGLGWLVGYSSWLVWGSGWVGCLPFFLATFGNSGNSTTLFRGFSLTVKLVCQARHGWIPLESPSKTNWRDKLGALPTGQRKKGRDEILPQ